MHWLAHDEWTSFQSGACFHYRRLDGSVMVERSVYAGHEDKRWYFHEHGERLPEENVTAYGARHKKDRLNEYVITQLLARLGASPRLEEFYALPEQRCYVLQRSQAPATVIRRRASEVIRAETGV